MTMDNFDGVASDDSVRGLNGSRRFWKVEVTVWADEKQVTELGHGIQLLLCPDPDHRPPCSIPWEIGWHEIEDTDPDAESLSGQVAAEFREQADPTA